MSDETSRHLRLLVDFAYEKGFHELGYDPVQDLAAELAAVKAERAAWEAEAHKRTAINEADYTELVRYRAALEAIAEDRDTPGIMAREALEPPK